MSLIWSVLFIYYWTSHKCFSLTLRSRTGSFHDWKQMVDGMSVVLMWVGSSYHHYRTREANNQDFVELQPESTRSLWEASRLAVLQGAEELCTVGTTIQFSGRFSSGGRVGWLVTRRLLARSQAQPRVSGCPWARQLTLKNMSKCIRKLHLILLKCLLQFSSLPCFHFSSSPSSPPPCPPAQEHPECTLNLTQDSGPPQPFSGGIRTRAGEGGGWEGDGSHVRTVYGDEGHHLRFPPRPTECFCYHLTVRRCILKLLLGGYKQINGGAAKAPPLLLWIKRKVSFLSRCVSACGGWSANKRPERSLEIFTLLSWIENTWEQGEVQLRVHLRPSILHSTICIHSWQETQAFIFI